MKTNSHFKFYRYLKYKVEVAWPWKHQNQFAERFGTLYLAKCLPLRSSMRQIKIHKSGAHNVDPSFSKKVFKCVHEHKMKFKDPLAVWHKYRGAGTQFFVGIILVLTDKTTISLKANATVKYPVLIVFLNLQRTICTEYETVIFNSWTVRNSIDNI